jgi:hypothetical protein
MPVPGTIIANDKQAAGSMVSHGVLFPDFPVSHA